MSLEERKKKENERRNKSRLEREATKKMHMLDRRMGWIMLGWINLCLVRAS